VDISHSRGCVDDLPGNIPVRALGIIVNVYPFEPEVGGFVTLESAHHHSSKIYANEGLCMCCFFESDEDCEVSYNS